MVRHLVDVNAKTIEDIKTFNSVELEFLFQLKYPLFDCEKYFFHLGALHF